MMIHPKFKIESLALPNGISNHSVYWARQSSSGSREELNIDVLSSAQRSHYLSLKSDARAIEFLASRQMLAEILTPLGPWKDRFDSVNGMIEWPRGWVGSLSHKSGYCVLGLATSGQLTSLGIDMERFETQSDISTKIMSNPEFLNLSNWLSFDNKVLCALVFSAKEALFKCLYPLGQKMFWFHDAEIIAASGTDVVKLMLQCPAEKHGFAAMTQFEVNAFSWQTDQFPNETFWIASCGIK